MDALCFSVSISGRPVGRLFPELADNPLSDRMKSCPLMKSAGFFDIFVLLNRPLNRLMLNEWKICLCKKYQNLYYDKIYKEKITKITI